MARRRQAYLIGGGAALAAAGCLAAECGVEGRDIHLLGGCLRPRWTLPRPFSAVLPPPWADRPLSSPARRAAAALLRAPEEALDGLRAADWFGEDFFSSGLWLRCQGACALRPGCDIAALRRAISAPVPAAPDWSALEERLAAHGVNRRRGGQVAGLDLEEGEGLTVTALHWADRDGERLIQLHEGDICLLCGGDAWDGGTQGPPPSAALWGALAAQRPGLGDPAPFFARPEQTSRGVFQAAVEGALPLAEGALHLFPRSAWGLALTARREGDRTALWGRSVYPERPGDRVPLPLDACCAGALLEELSFHLGRPLSGTAQARVLPFAAAHLQPHRARDLPPALPEGSDNLGFLPPFALPPAGRGGVRAAVYALWR